MELIPVLDLMGGVVVRARRGERDAYRPIETPLCAGADPLDMTATLLGLAPFRTLYIADLDAIRRTGGHDRVIAAIAARFPALDLWVDAGDDTPEAIARRRAEGPGVPVLGTEIMRDGGHGRALLAAAPSVLSLDHDSRGRLGPEAIHDEPAPWPERVVVMTLARVGAGQGPDLDRLDAVIARARCRHVYAAGGVRHGADLDRLAQAGAAGVLLASALHDGGVSAADLARFAG
ncbi:HisA/HisF-related TIM barrel protein [Ancylobacter terrae]|uniref:HisA/HisF-related TIM barrel protein n=1 Tax=Ancylobacter sp. sgz301288 TaxID=3342077 RepID=UPI00385B7A25